MSTYSYEATLAASEKGRWRVEDIIGKGKSLDFNRSFMPESLARVESLTFLSKDEKRILNQIRGNAYLCIFGVVEEFILPFLMDHIRPSLMTDDYRTRALIQFAGEEAKHIDGERRRELQRREQFKVDQRLGKPALPPDEQHTNRQTKDDRGNGLPVQGIRRRMLDAVDGGKHGKQRQRRADKVDPPGILVAELGQ